MPEKPHNFWQELKRRKVVRVITVYAAAAFVIIELTNNITEPLSLPEWVPSLVIVLLAIGLLISIVMSWVYDITPEGVQKTKRSTKDSSETKQPSSLGWKISTYISILVIIAFTVFYIMSNIKQSSNKYILEGSIAVLPFKSLSDNPEKQYLADGVMDAILLHLSKIENLHVIARTSVEQYRETTKTATVIGKELNVAYVLEGSFQKYGDNARLIVQLIKTIDGGHQWSNEYNREWKNIFSVQSEVAHTIANELNAVITPKEKKEIDIIPTGNLEAYNIYLKGRFFWHRRTEEDLEKSIYYFNQAIKLDTNYALAYTGLADAYFILPWYSSYPSNDAFIKAKKYAEKALSINQNIAEAHSALGSLAIYHEHNWKLAEEELKQAIKLNPNYYVAHQAYYELLSISGRNSEAEDQINLAIKYNPNFFVILQQRADFHYREGKYLEAIEDCKKVLEIKYWFPSMSCIFNSYIKLGKDIEALDQLKAIIINIDSNNYDNLLDEIYLTSGINGVIYWYIDWLIKHSSPEFIDSDYIIARLYAIVGNDQKTLEYLERIIDSNKLQKLYIKREPDFNILKTDPRYISMLKEMGL